MLDRQSAGPSSISRTHTAVADSHICILCKYRVANFQLVIFGRIKRKWYFVTKIVKKNCSRDREKKLSFEAEGQEITKILKLLSLQPRISKVFLDHENIFFSQQVRTILVTKYHFSILLFLPEEHSVHQLWVSCQ